MAVINTIEYRIDIHRLGAWEKFKDCHDHDTADREFKFYSNDYRGRHSMRLVKVKVRKTDEILEIRDKSDV